MTSELPERVIGQNPAQHSIHSTRTQTKSYFVMPSSGFAFFLASPTNVLYSLTECESEITLHRSAKSAERMNLSERRRGRWDWSQFKMEQWESVPGHRLDSLLYWVAKSQGAGLSPHLREREGRRPVPGTFRQAPPQLGGRYEWRWMHSFFQCIYIPICRYGNEVWLMRGSVRTLLTFRRGHLIIRPFLLRNH